MPYRMVGNELVSQFPHEISVRRTRLDGDWIKGDRLVIVSVRGDRKRIEVGGTYLVQGAYVLEGGMDAALTLNVTTRAPIVTSSQPMQGYRVERGRGLFALVETMTDPGQFHLSFYYAVPGHRSQRHGAIYFTNAGDSLQDTPRGKVAPPGARVFKMPILSHPPLPPQLNGTALDWAQLQTGSPDWNRHPNAPPRLMKFFEDTAGFRLGRVWSEASADDLPQLSGYPFLFAETIGGLTPSGARNLAEYLKRGGFILIDACINSGVNPDLHAFLAEQLAVLRPVLPDVQLKALGMQDGIYTTYFKISSRPPTGDPGSAEPLRALVSGGRTVGIVSVSGLECGIAGYGERTAREECEEMIANIYLYAMTR